MKSWIAREMKEQGANMETIIRVRQDLRSTISRSTDVSLAEGEHFRLACLSMASLGQKDEKKPYKTSQGEWVTVGPYVSNAVRYVLQGTDHTEHDYRLVLQHTLLINAARRV